MIVFARDLTTDYAVLRPETRIHFRVSRVTGADFDAAKCKKPAFHRHSCRSPQLGQFRRPERTADRAQPRAFEGVWSGSAAATNKFLARF